MRSLMRAIALATALAFASAAPALLQPAAAQQTSPIDINTASRDTLQTLKGIGPARAEAIVKGRPYKGKDDLVHKKIVPQSVYDDIKDKIIARQK